MRTKRNHITIRFQNTAQTNGQDGPRRLGLFAAITCIFVLIGIGCGMHPKPVASREVSPIQLRSRPRQKAPAQPEAPKATASPVEPKPIAPRPQPTLPSIDRTVDDQTQSPLPSAGIPQQQVYEAEPAEPAQASAEPTKPPEAAEVAAIPEEQQPPAPLPQVEMPALKQPGMAGEPVSVNFEDVDIRMVLKTIGDITGINFIPHASVSGKVTVMSPTPIRLGDIYAFLQSILDVYGYATIEGENAVKIVPKADATKHGTQVRIGADPAYIPRNDAIATQIMPLRYASAAEISEIVKPALSAAAQMAIYPRTNSIMITDTSANIHHIAQIVQQLDVEGSRERVLMLPLAHASAQVVSEQITRILERADATTSQAPRGRGAPSPSQGLQILPDERTNSVIAVASEQDIETIRKLVAQLDIERPIGTDNVHVTYLKNADANEVARALDIALAGMRSTGIVEATQPIQVTPHGSTNSLIIAAAAQDFEVISRIIDKLDIVREQVQVEMRIIEVTEEALKEIGIDWATLDDAIADSVRGFALTNLGPRVDFLNGDLEGLAVGAWKETGSGVKIGAILQALERQSGVNILSMPHITTSNHRKATIIVGENRPFVTESRITETADPITPTVIQGFEYRDVGITLEITPHVSQGGLVRLEVDSEFTKLIEDVATSSLTTPVTAKRTAQTVVTMSSGATVVIGGLIRDDKTRIQQKVPLVGDLPLVGPLFRSQRDRSQKTNLLIFITPTVMANQEELLAMTKQKQQQMADIQERSR